MRRPYVEETLGDLIAELQPAPQGWVEAAKELPEARRAIESIVEHAQADAEFRAQAIAELERALQAEGVEPTPRAVNELRNRLATG